MFEVAVGILQDEQGRYLFQKRPEGKPLSGYWEFPGGKIEKHETTEIALARELWEELGIDVQVADCRYWYTMEYEYPHAVAKLNFCRVHEWHNEPEGLEGQVLSWETLPASVTPVLPGMIPVLDLLALGR
jgi:8-oxo-dGTP diphosphatase